MSGVDRLLPGRQQIDQHGRSNTFENPVSSVALVTTTQPGAPAGAGMFWSKSSPFGFCLTSTKYQSPEAITILITWVRFGSVFTA